MWCFGACLQLLEVALGLKVAAGAGGEAEEGAAHAHDHDHDEEGRCMRVRVRAGVGVGAAGWEWPNGLQQGCWGGVGHVCCCLLGGKLGAPECAWLPLSLLLVIY